MTDSKPQPGEFRVARLGEHLPRLTLVIQPISFGEDVEAQLLGVNSSRVRLVTNELEYATHRDVRLEESETGLSYPVLLETDLQLPVWNWQLDGPIGRLGLGFEELLQERPDLSKFEPSRAGLEMPGPWDSRWAWKEREISQLQRLGSEVFGAYIDYIESY